MKAIVVDDEPLMLRKFERLVKDIDCLDLIGSFRDPEKALSFMKETPADLAFLDIGMPVINGIELAKRLREIRQDILIVFITAYDEYIREANEIGSDYYVVKPYSKETLEKVVGNMCFLSQRQKKPIFIQTFGRFNVFKNGQPIPLKGKAKEILALIVTKRGKEISNEEIFTTVWEDKPYCHDNMKAYFNALHRLKSILKENKIEKILISTMCGQMVDPQQFDCDYYQIKEKASGAMTSFEGEFLSEYSWGESTLSSILDDYFKR